MIFRQLVDPDLGCACYLVGDGGRAVVVDPGLHVDQILDAARDEGVRVEAIVETHVHADHVSGRELLARQTGAEIRVPAGGGHEYGAGEPLAAGDVIVLGRLRIEALPAPGHRPEHLALLVSDLARCPDPCMLLSGDSMMVGGVARPDLAVDAHEGARSLHATLGSFGSLPGDVELWPGHVGGSLCGGGSLSPRTSSTLGYERRANPLLRGADGVAFAEQLVGGTPSRPPTVERVVARNRRAAPAASAALDVLPGADLRSALRDGAVLVDARSPEAFDDAHALGSVNLPLPGRGVATRAAWLLDPEAPVVVAGAAHGDAAELARRLRAVGFEHVDGLLPGGPRALAAAGLEIQGARSIPVQDLPAWLDEVVVVDVRDEPEWRVAHLAGSIHLPLARLRPEADRLPARPLAVACATGRRAASAAAWLRRAGHHARRVTGGGIGDLEALGVVLVAAR
jgi:glyoxylase-like metal-dependent hydrolase (beta-lactamase superfamily II)/rhodanese-related sulfurtransferase